MGAFKAVLVGEAGVGKSTLSHLLRCKPVESFRRKPTVGVNIEQVKTEHGNMCLWDLAGQRRFQFMWDEFMRGSELTILVTDSSAPNVMMAKDIIERHLNNSASKIIAIANKQDLKGRMKPAEIEAALGVPTFGMVGIDSSNEKKLKKIIEKNL
ncbi:MAG: ADP-ribosylation factor-like protein [Promethearchaeota archaeon]